MSWLIHKKGIEDRTVLNPYDMMHFLLKMQANRLS